MMDDMDKQAADWARGPGGFVWEARDDWFGLTALFVDRGDAEEYAARMAGQGETWKVTVRYVSPASASLLVTEATC